jgi:hypothetical protein
MGEIAFRLIILGHSWIHLAVHRLRDAALRKTDVDNKEKESREEWCGLKKK